MCRCTSAEAMVLKTKVHCLYKNRITSEYNPYGTSNQEFRTVVKFGQLKFLLPVTQFLQDKCLVKSLLSVKRFHKNADAASQSCNSIPCSTPVLVVNNITTQHYQTTLPNNITKQHYQTTLPHNITTQHYHTTLPHNITKQHHHTTSQHNIARQHHTNHQNHHPHHHPFHLLLERLLSFSACLE